MSEKEREGAPVDCERLVEKLREIRDTALESDRARNTPGWEKLRGLVEDAITLALPALASEPSGEPEPGERDKALREAALAIYAGGMATSTEWPKGTVRVNLDALQMLLRLTDPDYADARDARKQPEPVAEDATASKPDNKGEK